jgi:tetratricopeptide (TPR) repeat protein
MRIKYILLIFCMLIVPCLSAQQNNAEKKAEFTKLAKQAAQAHTQKEYKKAISLYEKTVALYPKQSNPRYNLACAYALSGNKTKALESLAKAVENGFVEYEHMERDPDLLSIRKTAQYKEILKRAKALADKLRGKDEIIFPSVKKKNLPMLIFLHGAGGNAQDFLSRFRPIANKEKMIVFLPCGSV